MTNKFHFFSYRPAVRFHITKQLEGLGWERAAHAKEALFTDDNLTLNDEISLHLEYKHLLAALVAKHCPDVMPVTYYINDQNYAEVFAKMTYDFYLPHGRYEPDIPGLKWILKPSMLNNGDEIRLFNNIEELKNHYQTTKRLGGDHVVQRYVPNPDLIDGRKYTFRIPLIVTNYTGIYLYREGYINISAYPFNLEDGLKNRKVHLTNYVLDGEFAHIEQCSTNTLKDFENTYQQMSQIIVSVMKGLLRDHPSYLQPRPHHVFEIFGVDFIQDQNKKVWLLEMNQGPDAPTFEDNVLTTVLWNKFWADIIDDFVLPIACQVPPKRSYTHFSKLLSRQQSYSYIKNTWDGLIRGLKKRLPGS
ncbi:MAG: hypothetical protein ACHQJ6_00335 [Candidatus Berkiellales bacterium]